MSKYKPFDCQNSQTIIVKFHIKELGKTFLVKDEARQTISSQLSVVILYLFCKLGFEGHMYLCIVDAISVAATNYSLEFLLL